MPKHSTKDAILKRVTDYYLNSRDFNGYPVRQIPAEFGIDADQVLPIVTSLVRSGLTDVITGEMDENPYIKRFPSPSRGKQLERLKSATDLTHACLYPSPSHLKRVVQPSRYGGRPFSLRLALGGAQLSYQAFDLTVLEFYRNDPRYQYDSSDIDGRISIGSKYVRKMRLSDNVFLQTFGFAYDKKLRRAVAVFLRYLYGLTPEHQQIWKAKALKNGYKLHPDYFRTAILGQWAEGISVFDAFLEELHHVNAMCSLIGRPVLFRDDFENKKPRGFGFLIRPTSKEFNDFVHLLDKMLSDNINSDFFMGEVRAETEQQRRDGKVEVRQKGTIQMLDEWLGLKFRAPDRQPIEEAIATLRQVRKLRQKPAHVVNEDRFDQKYLKHQRELMTKAYDAVRTQRLMFANHPKARDYKVPDVLQTGRIWTY